jgi:hypothetical protein
MLQLCQYGEVHLIRVFLWRARHVSRFPDFDLDCAATMGTEMDAVQIDVGCVTS